METTEASKASQVINASAKDTKICTSGDAIEFVATCPFGMNAMEQNAWCYYGGGIEAADKAYNSIGVKFLPLGNTGNQMGGWYNKEINSIEDFNGVKIRMPGLGGEVLKSYGANTVLLAGSDVLPALASACTKNARGNDPG